MPSNDEGAEGDADGHPAPPIVEPQRPREVPPRTPLGHISEDVAVEIPRNPPEVPMTVRPRALSAPTAAPSLAGPAFVALVLAALLAWAPLPAAGQTATPATAAPSAAGLSAEEAIATITEESFYNRLYFIASDALMGRDTPSPGLEAAAKYIVSEYKRMGVQPAGEDGTYYQRWPYRQIRTDADAATLEIRGDAGTLAFDGGSMAVRGASDEALELGLVAVGAPGDIAGQELEGRALVFHHPGELSQQWFQQANQVANAAGAAGAGAVILVVDDAMAAEGLPQLRQNFQGAQWRMGWELPLPQLFVTRSDFAQAVEAAAGDGTLPAGELQASLAGELPAEILVDGRPPNVVGKIEGSDPELRDEYMVLSAHFDHIGVTSNPVDGDSINNGADDNGSGTVALMEVARAISEMDEAPRRSILFVHVSGEEKGLLGSEWFVEQPTVPLESMVASINADMIAGDQHTDTLVVIGKDYSSLGPLVDEINDGMPELNLTTSDDLWPEQRFFFRSDQFHFLRKEIPSLFFFTGVHECYHAVCDTVDFVDHDKGARITRLLAHSVLEIANADERPQWDPAGLEEVRELTGGGR
ncbi:MAG: M28 family peptidase [Gemmatimonadales bacterium]|nr:MAG: M28 family peptidase [Gemmatimonadales bacterium]